MLSGSWGWLRRRGYFEAIARTAATARAALERGLAVHGREYGLPDDWWHGFAEEISERRIDLGRCRRDGEAMNDE